MKYSLFILIFLTTALILGSQGVFYSPIALAASSATINATAKLSVCGNGVKETDEQCDVSSFGGRTCTYLGFDGGTLSCSASCEYNTSSCTTTAEQTVTPIFSASIGGSYIILDQGNSAKISLPANFYTQDMRLQMFAFDTGAAQVSTPAPTGKYFIGKVYDFVPIDSSGNIISTLSQPATITLTYTNVSTSVFDASTFAPYYRTSGSTVWHLISGYAINTANKQITFTVNSLNSFTILGGKQTTTPSSVGGSGSSSTGGGGSSGSVASMTTLPLTSTVTLSGRAYPQSTVTILKDAVVAATVHVGEDAKFSVTIRGLSGGTYLFSVYTRDNKGDRSSITTIPASVTSGTDINESGIFLSPTLHVDKSEVKRGDPVRIFGRAFPKSKVTISVHSVHQLFFKTSSDKDGVYSYSFLTTPLEMGQHTASVISSVNGEVSRTSSSVSYTVGIRNVAKTTNSASGTFLLGDVNNDGKVNLIDFSIGSFWYHKPKPPSLYDINGDGFVNIIDFSIMASNWTG